ncbi:uncharacterized protein LOC103574139 [Microplitis demolitor]|uniref:uncharacterized protein LOC103574139 n=1 Tax=Microplitis demolitor TaxID=69319 RepID=UPI0004CCBBCE|nr:uncharacterized protein LOC103574139 [Microplitis demolitor]
MSKTVKKKATTEKPEGTRLPNNKPIFQRAVIGLHGKIINNTLKIHVHSTTPGLNLNKTPWVERWDVENVMNLYSPFPFACDLPKPLLPPAKTRRHLHTNDDPATDILFTKRYIKEEMDAILDNYQMHQNDHTSQLKKDLQWSGTYNKGETILPRYIANLADHIEMDPDPYFEGKYNWYYTGGSLNNLCFNGSNLLIFPYVNDLVVAPISLRENSLWKPALNNATKVNIDNTLYETRYNISTESCRLLARFKHECIFYSLTEKNGELNLIALDNKESKSTPFISADLNPIDPNQYCTFNVGRTFELCDMVSGKCLSKGTVDMTKVLDDSWGSIKYTSNPNIVALTDRCCLHYIDLRVSLEIPTVTMCPKYRLDRCDSLSLHFPSARPSRHYIGTYHSFLMCDDRSPDKSIQQKWTHQLRTAPLSGSAIMHDGEEFIVISSLLPSDKSIIINTWQHYDDPHSYHLPRTPPSILDTLRESRLLGKCLDPLLASRLELSAIGSTSMIYDTNVYHFSQNSLEDIFYSCFTHDSNVDRMDYINDHARYALEVWDRQILNQEKSIAPLVLTDRFNMAHIFEKFSQTELKYELVEEESFLPEYWRQPIDKLKEYVDILAPVILSAWELDEEGETVATAKPHQKVLNWLETAASGEVDAPVGSLSQEPQEMQSSQANDEDYIPFTPINSQELISVSQQHQEYQEEPELDTIDIKEEIIDADIDLDIFMPKIKVVSQRKDTKNKSKNSYISGF